MANNKYTSQELLQTARNAFRDIGYLNDLLLEHYPFTEASEETYQVRYIDFAAFAQDPPSYRNACFGITIVEEPSVASIRGYRFLGAPQIISLYPKENEIYRWQITAKDSPKLIEKVDISNLAGMIHANQQQWNPKQVLRAKSVGFTLGPKQLDFFDVGLIPVIEELVHHKLDQLIKDVIASSVSIYSEHRGMKPDDKTFEALFRLIFRFIAAKLLIDRKYPGSEGLLYSEPKSVISEIERFYFQASESSYVLDDDLVQEAAWNKIRTAFHFPNISVEALAYIYENTLVTAEVRKRHNTHATPPEIAEYIVKNLPFEQLHQNDRRVFEPFSGHAPFLIAALGRLRNLLPADMQSNERHNYLVNMLSGMEIDPFAREVAHYSLRLADYPNPNGWRISAGDIFSSKTFNKHMEDAKIVLCNPPYGKFPLEQKKSNHSIIAPNQAAEALRRIFEYSPEMFGFVLPGAFIDGRSFRDIRKKLDSYYDRVLLIELPDKIFQYSEAETVLALGYGAKSVKPEHHILVVKKEDYNKFFQTGSPTEQAKWEFSSPQKSSNIVRSRTPLLEDLWDILSYLPKLDTMVEIHRGVEYNRPISECISAIPKTGFIPGLQQIKQGLEPYIVRSHIYLDNNPGNMRTKAYRYPWHEPKVIANAARLSRGSWRIASAVDRDGLLCTQRFHGIWSKDSNMPLEVVSALLNSPVSNAFLSTMLARRDNTIDVVRQIPVPIFNIEQIKKITDLVSGYISYRKQWIAGSMLSGIEKECLYLMLEIDAELLKSYKLPARLERSVLDYFSGQERPGPIYFTRYYPKNFSPAIPLHVYISKEFWRSSAEQTIERLPVLYDRSISKALDELEA